MILVWSPDANTLAGKKTVIRGELNRSPIVEEAISRHYVRNTARSVDEENVTTPAFPL